MNSRSTDPRTPEGASAPTRAGQRTLAIALLATLLLGAAFAFRDTVQATLRVWNTSNFEHSYVIPVISAWLLWRQRAELASTEVATAWTALPVLAGAALLWLAGRLAGVNAVEQFALFAMLPPLVALLFGWRMLWAAAFAIGFLFFAVPVGEFLQPKLMEWTADFTVAAIMATGIPIARDGLYFELPTGRWSVVEACSGLRYMLAALPLACVYAYLSYRALGRRLLFIALAIAVALVGNWLRAYMIVMIGHLSGMQLAVGFDHLIYGWLFFGVLMAIVFWIGSRWEDPVAAQPQLATHAAGATRVPARSGALAAAACAAALIAGTPFASQRLMARGNATIDLDTIARGFASADPPGTYRPGFSGAVKQAMGRALVEPPVGVAVHQYVRQHENAEMISHGNRVLPHSPNWRSVRCATASSTPGSTTAAAWPVNECELLGPGEERQLVWNWYWVNGRMLSDEKLVKIFTALDLLLGRGDESLAWFVWTPVVGNATAARAHLASAAAALSHSPPLAQLRTAR